MFDAIAREDYEALAAAFAPDVEWEGTPQSPLPGVWRGHAGVRDFLTRWRELWQDYRVETEEVVELDDRMVVVCREHARGKESGAVVERTLVQLCSFRDNRITRVRFYASKAEALAAAGLDE